MIGAKGDTLSLVKPHDRSRRRRLPCPALSSWPVGAEARPATPALHRPRTREAATLPSIVVTDRGDAGSVGSALAERHEELSRAGLGSLAVVRAAVRFFGQSANAPSARIALDLAAQADAMGHRHPYHNASHLCEVTVNMANLAALNASRHTDVVLCKNDIILAIAAAVSHDLHHDGATNDVPLHDEAGRPVFDVVGKPVTMNVPFLLEDKSIAAINIAGQRAGVRERNLQRLRALVLITDPVTGYRILDAMQDPQCDPGKRSELLALRPELAMLNDPATLRMALMLRDADLLGSCGTSATEHDRETARLEKERGMPAGGLHGRGTEYFMGTIARGRFLSPEGQFFQRNLDYLRGLNFTRLQTGDPRTVTLAELDQKR